MHVRKLKLTKYQLKHDLGLLILHNNFEPPLDGKTWVLEVPLYSAMYKHVQTYVALMASTGGVGVTDRPKLCRDLLCVC